MYALADPKMLMMISKNVANGIFFDSTSLEPTNIVYLIALCEALALAEFGKWC